MKDGEDGVGGGGDGGGGPIHTWLSAPEPASFGAAYSTTYLWIRPPEREHDALLTATATAPQREIEAP